MKRVLCVAAMLALALIPFAVSGQDKKKDRDEILAKFMQKKLISAHLVLDGVVLGDFKKITHGGEELIRLANTETWQLIRSPHYELHSKDFIPVFFLVLPGYGKRNQGEGEQNSSRRRKRRTRMERRWRMSR